VKDKKNTPKINNLDKKDWENYISNPSDVFDKDSSSSDKLQVSRFNFDLHGYSLLDANIKVTEIINSCFDKGHQEILLITGKGIHSKIDGNVYASKNMSKLKYSIPDYINSKLEIKNKISSINTASKEDGGDGALIIKLKKL
jgi:DNA-nicking Smr family endonuclease